MAAFDDLSFLSITIFVPLPFNLFLYSIQKFNLFFCNFRMVDEEDLLVDIVETLTNQITSLLHLHRHAKVITFENIPCFINAIIGHTFQVTWILVAYSYHEGYLLFLDDFSINFLKKKKLNFYRLISL